MLRTLKRSDKLNFFAFAKEHNISVFLFRDFIKRKKVAFISEEADIINGLLFINKQDDDYYLNIISKTKKIANNLLKIFFWNWKKEIYAKIEENNKVGFILKENGFKIINKKDNIFLLYYNPKEKRKRYGKRDNL